jgi:hypothetical protein
MIGMIACTKLFVIDDVRLVIFKGTLNFIDFSTWAGDFPAGARKYRAAFPRSRALSPGRITDKEVLRLVMPRLTSAGSREPICPNDNRKTLKAKRGAAAEIE